MRDWRAQKTEKPWNKRFLDINFAFISGPDPEFSQKDQNRGTLIQICVSATTTYILQFVERLA